jgi:signal peptidase I
MNAENERAQSSTGPSSQEEETIEPRTLKTVLWEWLKTLVYAVALALFIRTFFLATYVIPTGSMEPTLHGAMNYGRGDRIIALKFIYGIRIPFTDYRFFELTEPDRGDIVVFESEGISGYTKKKKHLIKRIVGLGGEQLEIAPNGEDRNFPGSGFHDTGGTVYINGEPLEQPETIAKRRYFPTGEYGNHEIRIPEDHYFMLGDNTRNSRDSRFWGFVPRENIEGKAVAIFWPPKRIGLIH